MALPRVPGCKCCHPVSPCPHHITECRCAPKPVALVTVTTLNKKLDASALLTYRGTRYSLHL
eukprot:scaffold186318_cov40-Tisochrysis_lutea.AAC.1